ncbi:hypothetical protein L6452_19914 [Arctium lappa]|uniref:Uncharacterized protein n=1 Tax=Arctium lappa TaxID=4217 RepID=A0ACB9BB72_ARCLA|nr:hypothetical protein L6452_19914 [Arctium lappa]
MVWGKLGPTTTRRRRSKVEILISLLLLLLFTLMFDVGDGRQTCFGVVGKIDGGSGAIFWITGGGVGASGRYGSPSNVGIVIAVMAGIDVAATLSTPVESYFVATIIFEFVISDIVILVVVEKYCYNFEMMDAMVAPGVALPGLPRWGTARPPRVGDTWVLPVLVPPGLPGWCFSGIPGTGVVLSSWVVLPGYSWFWPIPDWRKANHFTVPNVIGVSFLTQHQTTKINTPINGDP